MKATLNTSFRSMLWHLNNVSSETYKLRAVATTGKRVSSASDDPSVVRQALDARQKIMSFQGYSSAMDVATDRGDMLDGYLNQAENILMRTKELSISGSNGTLTSSARQAMADEVVTLQSEMMSLANIQIGDQYTFAGFEEHTRPFIDNPAYDPVLDPRPVLYQGDTGVSEIAISPNETVPTNIIGSELFLGDADNDGTTDAGKVDIFATMNELKLALEAGDDAAINASIDSVEQAMEQVRLARSSVGNIGRRIENAQDQMEDATIDMQEILSRYEDVDLAETLSSLARQEFAFEAALKLSGDMANMSILDYL